VGEGEADAFLVSDEDEEDEEETEFIDDNRCISGVIDERGIALVKGDKLKLLSEQDTLIDEMRQIQVWDVDVGLGRSLTCREIEIYDAWRVDDFNMMKAMGKIGKKDRLSRCSWALKCRMSQMMLRTLQVKLSTGGVGNEFVDGAIKAVLNQWIYNQWEYLMGIELMGDVEVVMSNKAGDKDRVKETVIAVSEEYLRKEWLGGYLDSKEARDIMMKVQDRSVKKRKAKVVKVKTAEEKKQEADEKFKAMTQEEKMKEVERMMAL
jgi:hypothetical protein